MRNVFHATKKSDLPVVFALVWTRTKESGHMTAVNITACSQRAPMAFNLNRDDSYVDLAQRPSAGCPDRLLSIDDMVIAYHVTFDAARGLSGYMNDDTVDD